MRFADRLFGMVMGLLGLLCFQEAYRIWNSWDSGGTFLILVGGILIFLSIAFIGFPSPRGAPIQWFSKKEILHIGTISLSFAMYLSAINWLGYSLSTWLFLFMVSKHISASRSFTIVIWTGTVAVVSGMIFKKFLSLPLPGGFIGL